MTLDPWRDEDYWPPEPRRSDSSRPRREQEYALGLVVAWVCLFAFCAVFWYGVFKLLEFVL